MNTACRGEGRGHHLEYKIAYNVQVNQFYFMKLFGSIK